MSTMIEETTTDFAAKLAETGMGCRLKIRRFGVSRVVDGAAKDVIAFAVGANIDVMSVAKKLIDTKDEDYRKVTGCLSQSTKFWSDNTLPWHDPGVRLCLNKHVDGVQQFIDEKRAEMDDYVAVLNGKFPSLIDAQEQKLGEMFNRADYPTTLIGAFDIVLEYPNLTVDQTLKEVNAKLYEEQAAIVRARFSEAVTMAEQAFATEMHDMLAHLCERMDGLNDDTTKRFDDKTIGSLNKFFDRFASLDLGSSEGLTDLVNEAKQVVSGTKPDVIRNNVALRDIARTALGGIGTSLQGMLQDEKRRFRF